MNAFISHASKDAALAVRLEELLEEDGSMVWLDHSEIRLGVLLRKELQTAIKNSRVLILLWSKAAAKVPLGCRRSADRLSSEPVHRGLCAR